MHDMARVLNAIDQGGAHAAEQLLPLVYDALRELAAAKLAHENAGQTLQATGLVHEAYLRLCAGGRLQHWDSRGHFFAAAAEAMRRILIDNARRKRRPKHGGGRNRVSLDAALCLGKAFDDDLLALDEALPGCTQRSAIPCRRPSFDFSVTSGGPKTRIDSRRGSRSLHRGPSQA